MGWKVSNGSYYIDKDEQKGREIDIIAQRHKSKTFVNSLEVVFSLIIEVKKSESKLWVFFTSESSDFEQAIFPKKFVKPKSTLTPSITNSLLREYTANAHERPGRNFYQGFTKNGARDDIYKALSGTTKAMYHFIDTNNNAEDDNGDQLLEYFEAVVVIKDKLFEAFLNEKGVLELNEVNYIQTTFNYLSPHYSNNYTNRHVIHVINESYLEEFFNERKDGLDNIFNSLKTNRTTE